MQDFTQSLRSMAKKLKAEIAARQKLLESCQHVLESVALAKAKREDISGGAEENDSPLLRPKPAILKLLRKKPNLTRVQILDALEDRVFSRSGNKRLVILITVNRLVKESILVRDEDGRHKVYKPRKRVKIDD